ncbi:hypothetical protein [Halarcobacter ebronensis]|uniref:Uncharacterized protein n=1 Tax=Halarcobacter ebronensis TaxID=1462615 RepID=A0A4Q1APM8_9BACT|nr:hypothetical protein [Halarcobacter ebronensis]QKF82054.1 hypothetical protein AEBR_1571 [Halarcobacter ebronensis]RXK04113.1 hypothetical protein CRV07_11850 [Halarcobacter ebronensis]
MYILENYDFLESLVKDGQVDKNQKFLKDGFCIADKKENPNHVFVFHFLNGAVWSTYGWTNSKNKSFLEFYKKIEKLMFSFNMPIYRTGKNRDFKNHTKFIGLIDGFEVYQYVRSF